MAPGSDLKDLATPRLNLREYRRDTRAATAGELQQETVFNSFVKQSATLYNLLPDSVKIAPNKMAAKAAIAKQTEGITQRVNNHRQMRGLHPLKTSW